MDAVQAVLISTRCSTSCINIYQMQYILHLPDSAQTTVREDRTRTPPITQRAVGRQQQRYTDILFLLLWMLERHHEFIVHKLSAFSDNEDPVKPEDVKDLEERRKYASSLDKVCKCVCVCG